jgi:HEAT repeat protein
VLEKSIVKDLQSPLEEIRREAIINLIRSAESKVISILDKMSREDPALKIRYLCRVGIAALKKSVDLDKCRKIKDFNTFSRLNQFSRILFLETMAKGATADMISLIVEISRKEKDPFIISRALKSIGLAGDKTIIQSVAPLLGHSDPRVVKSAILALGQINHPGALLYFPLAIAKASEFACIGEAITETIDSFDRNMIREYLNTVSRSKSKASRIAVCRFIGAFGSSDLHSTLRNLSEDSDDEVKAAAIKAITETDSNISDEPAFDFMVAPETMDGIANAENIAVRERLSSQDPRARILALREILQEGLAPVFEDELLAMTSCEDDLHVLATTLKSVGAIRTSGAMKVLMSFLNNHDSRVRTNAIEGLMHFAPSDYSAMVRPLLNDDNNRVRATACMSLKTDYPDEVIDVLEKMALHGTEADKISAIYAIQDIASRELVSILASMCGDPSGKVRERAFTALSVMSHQGDINARAMMAMEVQADEEDTLLGLTAVMKEHGLSFRDLCAELSKEEVELESIIFGLESPVEKEKLDSLRVLENVGDEKCLDYVQKATRDPSSAVRKQAATTFSAIKRRLRGFQSNSNQEADSRSEINSSGSSASDHHKGLSRGQLKGSSLIDPLWLRTVLEGATREERITALKRISIYDSQTLPVLIAHVPRETDPFVKPILATVVGMLGDVGALPVLLPLLEDQDPRVRANTVEAIEYLNHPRVYPAIVAMIDDENRRVRENVAKALRNLGGEKVMKTISSMSKSERKSERTAAARAMCGIVASWAPEILANLIRTEKSLYITAMALKALVRQFRGGQDRARTLLEEISSRESDRDKRRVMLAVLHECIKGSAKVESIIEREGILPDELEETLDFEDPLDLFETYGEAMPDLSDVMMDLQENQNLSKTAQDHDGNDIIDKNDISGPAEPPDSPEEKKSDKPVKIEKAPVIAQTEDSERQLPDSVIEKAEQEKSETDIIEDLIEQIEKGDPNVRKNAINAIIHAGISDDQVRHALTRALHDHDLVVKYFAKKALDKLFPTKQSKSEETENNYQGLFVSRDTTSPHISADKQEESEKSAAPQKKGEKSDTKTSASLSTPSPAPASVPVSLPAPAPESLPSPAVPSPPSPVPASLSAEPEEITSTTEVSPSTISPPADAPVQAKTDKVTEDSSALSAENNAPITPEKSPKIKTAEDTDETTETISREMEEIAILLVSDDSNRRQEGILKATESKSPEATAMLKNRLRQETDGQVARQILEGLIHLQDPNALKLLEKNLLHPSPTVRHFCLEYLVDKDIVRYYPKVIRFIDDPDPEVADIAVEIITIFDGDTAQKTLTKLATSDKKGNRLLAVKCLSLLQNSWSEDILSILAADIETDVREMAAANLDK